MLALTVVAVAVICLICGVSAYDPKNYLCSICIASSEASAPSIKQGCDDRFGKERCDVFFDGQDGARALAVSPRPQAVTPRDHCRAAGYCPASSPIYSQPAAGSVDFRVSKALGSRGYDKVKKASIAREGKWTTKQGS
jgi:hypothetical protein